MVLHSWLIEQGVFTSYVHLVHELFEIFEQFHCLSSSQNNLNLNDLVLIQPHFPIMLNLQTYFELFMCTILQILNQSRTVKFKLYYLIFS